MKAGAALSGAVLTAALTAGCGSGGNVPANNQAEAAPTVAPAPPTPEQQAQRKVLQQLRTAASVRFGDAQVFTSQGATIVCGRFQQAGQGPARYIAVGEDDVFVETQMQAGHMDQAVTEFCRNG